MITSKSGWKTEVIPLTLEQLRSRLEQNLPEIKLSHLEPSYTWASYLLAAMIPNATISQLMGFEPLDGVIFTGRPGNGRHTTAEALAGSLCPSKYSKLLRLSGRELDPETAAEALAVMDDIGALTREAESVCLLLDQIEDSRWSSLIQTCLAELLSQPEVAVFVILITGDNSVANGPLRRLMRCHCPEPSAPQRQDWLAEKINEPVPLRVDGMSVKEMTEATEDFSWRQMAELWNCMKLRLVWKVVERQKEFIAEKKPLKKVLSDGLVHLERVDLMEILHGLKDQLPPRQTAAPVQILAGTVPTETEEPQQIDKDKAAELVEFHSHPERMSGAQLLDVDF